jgi:hypothetical protein
VSFISSKLADLNAPDEKKFKFNGLPTGVDDKSNAVVKKSS